VRWLSNCKSLTYVSVEIQPDILQLLHYICTKNSHIRHREEGSLKG